MTLPKMHWLPKDQWKGPRAGLDDQGLTGRTPLARLFSGFWLSPCLLSVRAEVDDVATALYAIKSAGPSRHSVELSGEQDLLNVSPGQEPGSLASGHSDGSAQPSLLAEKESALLAPAHDHVRDAKSKAFTPAGDSERGTKDHSGSKAAVKRGRDNDDEDNTGKAAKQRHTKPSQAESCDRSFSRERRDRSELRKEGDRYEQSRRQDRSTAEDWSWLSKHGSRDSQPSASQSRSPCRRDNRWPFKRGRIVPCSTKMSVDMLLRLRFGSDHKDHLEGLSSSTAVFLWNYEKQKMHGIFAGTSRPVEDTPKDAAYLYEVRVENYAEYRSLPKEVALRLVPRDGKTRYGETLLKQYLDADHVERLCSAFAQETDR